MLLPSLDIQNSVFVILNLVLIESLLSVDNAAGLATIVMRLPEHQRAKALKYGIFGAYFFRGLCLVFASLLLKFAWLKVIGGAYLIYLGVNYFLSLKSNSEESEEENKPKEGFFLDRILGTFWSTVALVEVMDLAFSIDNVFAAVAFTNNLTLICIGVGIGILAMRFAAQFFISLMHKYPFLEKSAFIVILFLGMKLINSFLCDSWHYKGCNITHGHIGDLFTSIITLLLFLVPIIYSNLKLTYSKERP